MSLASYQAALPRDIYLMIPQRGRESQSTAHSRTSAHKVSSARLQVSIPRIEQQPAKLLAPLPFVGLQPTSLAAGLRELEGYEISFHSCKKVIFFCKINIARKATKEARKWLSFGPSKGHVAFCGLLYCPALCSSPQSWLTYLNFFPNEISFSSRPTKSIRPNGNPHDIR